MTFEVFRASRWVSERLRGSSENSPAVSGRCRGENGLVVQGRRADGPPACNPARRAQARPASMGRVPARHRQRNRAARSNLLHVKKCCATPTYSGMPSKMLNGNVNPSDMPKYSDGLASGMAVRSTAGTAM